LREPEPAPPGRADVATLDDAALVRDWIGAFGGETGAHASASRAFDARLAAGFLTIWRDGRGTPVALAGTSLEVDGVRRIGPVYTVEQHRRRGYGAAVTAVACRRALEAGTSELLLYADVANATSNTLYRRLGFEPVEDRVELRFEPRSATAAEATRTLTAPGGTPRPCRAASGG
jgi:predicted GNAT family acetyltransferase